MKLKRPIGVALLSALAACSGDHVNRAAGRIALDTTPTTEILAAAPDGTILLGNASGGTRLSDGTLVIADTADFVIRMFSASGAPVRTFGAKGQGPGEFQAASMLAQCAHDTVFLFDNRQDRLMMIDSAGTFLRSIPLSSQPVVMACSRAGEFLRVEYALESFMPTAQTAGTMYRFPVDLIIGQDTTRLYDSLPGYDPRPGGRMFGVAIAGDRAYVGLTDSAWVAGFDTAGRQVSSLRISDDPRPSTQEYYEHAVNAFFNQYPRGSGLDLFRPRLLALPRPEHMPAWHALFGAPDGTLWTQISSPDDSTTHLRATDSLGAVIADLTLPFPMTIFEIGNDYILGRRENEAGEQRVVVYRMGRREGGRTGKVANRQGAALSTVIRG
jgi:hypothetical protein